MNIKHLYYSIGYMLIYYSITLILYKLLDNLIMISDNILDPLKFLITMCIVSILIKSIINIFENDDDF